MWRRFWDDRRGWLAVIETGSVTDLRVLAWLGAVPLPAPGDVVAFVKNRPRPRRAEHGPTDREELNRLVGGRYWGPGRFGVAVQAAVAEGAVRRLSRRTYAPVDTVP